MYCKQQPDILTVYQTQFFAKLHKQIKNRLRFKFYLESNDSKGLNAMSAFEILAAIGTLSFGKSFKCINSLTAKSCYGGETP